MTIPQSARLPKERKPSCPCLRGNGLFSFERKWRQHYNHNLELSWPSFVKFDAIGKPRIAIFDFVADTHHNGVIVMTVCSNAQVSFHISLSSDWSCCRGKLVATRVGKTCIANIHTMCTQHIHIHAVKYHPPLVNDQLHFKRFIIFQISNQIYELLSAASSCDNFSASTSCKSCTGWIFNCSSRLSITNMKNELQPTRATFQDIFNVKRLLVGWAICFLFSTTGALAVVTV